MIPYQLATAPPEVQRERAQAIVDLHLGRHLDSLADLDPADQHEAIVDRMAELRRLVAPFGRDQDGRRRLGAVPGTEVLVDLADFLRRFPGDPALLGDICLVQADARISSVVLRPLLGRDPITYHRETDWLGRVAADIEEGAVEYEVAEAGIRCFHAEVAEAGRALRSDTAHTGSADPAEEGAEGQLDAVVEVCEARVAAFDAEGRARGRYLPLDDTPQLTLVRGVPVPVDLRARLGRVARGLLARPARRDTTPEDEPRQRPMH